MDFWQGFIVVTIVHLLAAASPGPDFALVTRQALVHGRQAAIWTSFGISLGLSIHLLYSTAGLAAVVAHSAQWMALIKLGGGGYLIFLGIKGLRSKPSQPDEIATTQAQTESARQQIITGFFCNALNPKAPVYFLSLFTVVLSPDMPLQTLAVYGLWIMALQMAWFTSLACLLSSPRIRTGLVRTGHWIDRAFGVAMLALGLQVISSNP